MEGGRLEIYDFGLFPPSFFTVKQSKFFRRLLLGSTLKSEKWLKNTKKTTEIPNSPYSLRLYICHRTIRWIGQLSSTSRSLQSPIQSPTQRLSCRWSKHQCIAMVILILHRWLQEHKRHNQLGQGGGLTQDQVSVRKSTTLRCESSTLIILFKGSHRVRKVHFF